jgi:hypothetical protein
VGDTLPEIGSGNRLGQSSTHPQPLLTSLKAAPSNTGLGCLKLSQKPSADPAYAAPSSTVAHSLTDLSKYPKGLSWRYTHDAMDGLGPEMFIRRKPAEYECHVRVLDRELSLGSSADTDLERR